MKQVGYNKKLRSEHQGAHERQQVFNLQVEGFRVNQFVIFQLKMQKLSSSSCPHYQRCCQ